MSLHPRKKEPLDQPLRESRPMRDIVRRTITREKIRYASKNLSSAIKKKIALPLCPKRQKGGRARRGGDVPLTFAFLVLNLAVIQYSIKWKTARKERNSGSWKYELRKCQARNSDAERTNPRAPARRAIPSSANCPLGYRYPGISNGRGRYSRRRASGKGDHSSGPDAEDVVVDMVHSGRE